MGKEKKEQEELLWAEGFRRTRQREALCRVLRDAGEPLCAVQIQKRMTESGEERWALSTVYRILGALEERNLVSKSLLMDQDTAYYQWNQGKHQHYAICLKCHRRILMAGCPLEEHALQLAEQEFSVTGHKIEIFGYCKTCRQKEEDDK